MSDDYEIITDTINCEKLEDCDNIDLDVDLTIYDKRKDFYYFTQIKYAVMNKPYLKDEVKAVTKDKTSIKKAITQLKDFPRALQKKSFVERLNEHNIQLKKNNYALIVIHSIPQCDFQEVGKVKLYEWNTFRNLLNRGTQNMMNINRFNPTTQKINHTETLDLEDIESVINVSLKNSPIDFKNEWKEFYWQYYDFTVSNQKYKCNIR